MSSTKQIEREVLINKLKRTNEMIKFNIDNNIPFSKMQYLIYMREDTINEILLMDRKNNDIR